VIPVVAFTRTGRPLGTSNLGASIGRTGLGAPGERIVGLSPSGDQVVWSGTSVAAAFVSGAIALLRSEFPELPAERIRSAVTASAGRRRSIVPPLLDTRAAWSWLHEHR
jgi:subtilisin family serine protease